jgi:transcriptional regulator with XRE-family HTH domain
MKLNNLTASAFADEIGVQRSSVSHILSGRNKPSLEFIQKVISKYPKVDAAWLISGATSVQSKIKQPEELGISAREKLANTERQQNDASTSSTLDKKMEAVPADGDKIRDSEKRITKILVFYSNGTFEELKSES